MYVWRTRRMHSQHMKSRAKYVLLYKVLRIVVQKDLRYTKIYNGIYGVIYEIYSLLRIPQGLGTSPVQISYIF